jgi:uncharacterized damage-inducible protein DinB
VEIHSVASFLDYYRRIRGRTLRVVERIPPEHLEWTYQAGKWTLGDLIRHLAALERLMFAENIAGRPSQYQGCGRELAEGTEAVRAYLDRCHEETLEILGQLQDEDLQRRCTTPGGASLPIWKWLRAMVEHEIHHRGQIYLYLSMLGVETPPLYGLTSEEVAARSA